MIMSLVLVGVGLLLLVVGGELLLRGAVTLATLARVTPAVIGLTVVAAGTSVPELAVSLIATLQGNEAVAIGNVVGSNLFNLTVILGLAAMIRPLTISGNTIRLEYPVLMAVTLLYVAFATDQTISRVDAGIFLGVYVVFTAYLVALVRTQINVAEAQGLQVEVNELTQATPSRLAGWQSLGLVALGIALLVGGAQATVVGAVELGRFWGMSERVIGLTIVAVGTGLPEIVTSLVSSIRGRDDIAIGNVVGSNLFNILGVLGINGLVQPVAIPSEIIRTDNLWLVGLTSLLFVFLFTGRRIARWEGALLLGSYVLYLALLLGRTPTG